LLSGDAVVSGEKSDTIAAFTQQNYEGRICFLMHRDVNDEAWQKPLEESYDIKNAYAGGHVGGAWGNDLNANYFDSPPVPSDARLKRDITLVARLDDGLGLYRYRYLWSDTVYVGVMAQEVALLHPDAIVRDALDAYLRIDYGRLGLRLMTFQEWEANSRGEAL
jgi:hypothetical protein